MEIRFRYNNRPRTVEVGPDTPASSCLSDEHQRRGTCATGNCLQCAVLLGGRVVPSCSLPAFRLEGAEVLDLEGLAGDRLHDTIMRAFDKVGISRCREALPGLLFLAYQLLNENPLPGDEELREYSRYLTTRCISREEFERAVRLAGRVYNRKHREQTR